MFEWVVNILNTGATGVIVTLFLGLEAYLRDRRASREDATIEEYLEWLRREEHSELLQGQQALLDKLEQGGRESELLQCLSGGSSKRFNDILATCPKSGDRSSASAMM